MSDPEDPLSGVGPRLRELRRDRGLTLAELAQRTGISTSTLSRLESGGRKPTLELLLPLARVHGVPLDDLVGAPPTGDPRVHIRPLQRHGQTILPLGQGTGGLQAFKHLIPAGPVPEPGVQQSHEGYEWIYVLAGRLRLRLGEHDFVMSTGEVAEFSTRTPHWFGRADTEAVEILSLYGPQGERMHVRARPKERQRGETPRASSPNTSASDSAS